MPGWKVHLIIGFIFSAIAFVILYYFNLFKEDNIVIYSFYPLIFIYAILPDIDTAASVIRRIMNIMLGLVSIGLIIRFILTKEIYLLYYAICAIIIFISLYLLKHRGITHTVFADLIVSIPLLFIDKYLALFCFIAYISHLIADKHKRW